MNVLVFDIETVPDVSAGRRLYGLEDLSDASVARAMFAKRRERTGRDFLSLELHRVVAISAVMNRQGRLSVWSLGDEDSGEADLVSRFFDGLDRYSPTLVSWNGSGFDLPVLHYRALLNGVQAPRYWESGDADSSFRYNNYLNRFHARHTDLMDVLSGYQPRGAVALDRLATTCGFPGKLGMSGEDVWDEFCAGNIAAIRAYCETDVVNTYLLYLRFEHMRGHLNGREYQLECAQMRDTLSGLDGEHWIRFLAAWTNGDGLEAAVTKAGRGTGQ